MTTIKIQIEGDDVQARMKFFEALREMARAKGYSFRFQARPFNFAMSNKDSELMLEVIAPPVPMQEKPQ